jgi:hypothetical protein
LVSLVYCYVQIILVIEWCRIPSYCPLKLPQLYCVVSLYKDMFYITKVWVLTHYLFNIAIYPIPIWNERLFCQCGKWAKLVTSLAESTYGRRCWICPDHDAWFEISLFIRNLRNVDCNDNNTLNIYAIIAPLWLY